MKTPKFNIIIIKIKIVCFIVVTVTFHLGLNANNPKYKVFVDVNKNNSLCISQIGEVLDIIPLDQSRQENFLNHSKVIVDENFVFFSFGAYPLGILQYDSKGNLLRIIEKAENIDFFDFPVFFDVDTIKNIIYIKCRKTVYSYDYNGKFIRKFEMPNYGSFIFYKDKLWGFNINFDAEGIDIYSLYSLDKDLKTSIWKEISYINDTECELFGNGVIPDPFLSSTYNNLYFSNNKENSIYKLNNNLVVPYIEYSFINGDFNCSDLLFRRSHLIGEEWLMVYYRMQGEQKSFLHQLKKNKTFNLTDNKIEDDIFGTQGIYVKNLHVMNNEYFCFTVPSSHIKSSFGVQNKNAKLCLIIMHIK